MEDLTRKKILVLCDFSEPAENAVHYAVEWADMAGLNVHILNVQNFPVPDMVLMATFTRNHDIQLDTALAELEKIKSRYTTHISISFSAEFGEVANSAEEYCQNNEVECVVMGIKSKNSFLVKWFGSNTTALINTIKVPILLIPPSCQFKHTMNIAFASDKRADEAKYLKLLHHLLGGLVINFLWIHIGAESEKNLMPDLKMQDIMLKLFPETSHHVENTDDIQEALAEITRENAVDMIVMRTNHKSLISRFTTKSVSREYSYKTTIPMLIFTS